MYHQLHNCLISPVSREPQALPYFCAWREERTSIRVPNLRWAGGTARPLVTRRACPLKNPGGETAAPPPSRPLLGFPVPGVATAHFLAQQTAARRPGAALTHVLLEGVGGEQRHRAGTRALVAAVRLRLGGCSGLGDPAAAS